MKRRKNVHSNEVERSIISNSEHVSKTICMIISRTINEILDKGSKASAGDEKHIFVKKLKKKCSDGNNNILKI